MLEKYGVTNFLSLETFHLQQRFRKMYLPEITRSHSFPIFKAFDYLPLTTFSDSCLQWSYFISRLRYCWTQSFFSGMSTGEIHEGVNDFSVKRSARLNQTLSTLGFISFVRAFFEANIEYSREGFAVQQVVEKDLEVNEQKYRLSIVNTL